MICQSCRIQHSPEIPFFEYKQKKMCIRCVNMEMIGVSNTFIPLEEGDKILSPFFKEQVLMGLPGSSYPYLEKAKNQLLFQAKEQAMLENGNFIMGAGFRLDPLEKNQYMLIFSGTIVWLNFWKRQLEKEDPPVVIPFSEKKKAENKKQEEKGQSDESFLDLSEEESAVGKYPDVGGDSQMNRFRKLVKKEE